MKTNAEIRNEAKGVLANRWGSAIVVIFVAGLLQGLVASPQVAFVQPSESSSLLYLLALIFVGMPVSLGITMTFLRASRGSELAVEGLFGAFNSTYYAKSILLNLLTSIYTFLWTMLFIVPGVIKALSYFLAPYILVDNPQLSSEEAICRSMKMMQGHKMDLFLMMLGFWGLAILSTFLLCIPLLWLVPYYMTVFARFYESVRAEMVEW